MTDLGFPNNPALNELFTSGWSTWMFDGVKWQASVPSGGVYEPVFGGRQFPMYGFLYQETAGDPGYSDWAGFGAHRWRFGISPGDDFAAGSIDYRGFVSDALSIVGAGATAGTRKINLYDNVNVSGNLTVGTTTILGGGGGIVSVGNITATGPLTISGPMGTTGSNAILTFQDRTGTTNWGWYAQAGVARLWNDQSGDRVTIDGGGSITTPGNVRAGGNLYLGGPYVLFSGVTAGGPFIYANATDMVAQLGTGNGTFYWMNNPGAEVMRLDSTGKLVAHNEIHSQGSLASFWFQDRGGAYEWAWYADSNTAHLYNTYGGVGRVVVTVDVNGQASFAQGVYGAAFAINGTGHYIYDAGGGSLGIRAGGAAGPYGYARLDNNGNWTCADVHAGRAFFQGIDGNDSLVVYRSGGGSFFTFKPETATNWGQIGYFNQTAGTWGTIEFPGVVQVDGVVATPEVDTWGWGIRYNGFTGGNHAFAFTWDGGHAWVSVDNGGATYPLANYYELGGYLPLGGGRMTGPIQMTNGGPQYRMSASAGTSGIGSMWYTDPSNMYLLLTANNDAWGGWNGLRPFVVDLASGNVTLGHLVTAQNWVNFNTGATFTSSSAGNVLQFNNGSPPNWLQLFDDGNGHLECNTNLWLNGNTGQGVVCGGALTVYGGFGTNGNITCQGSIYTNHVVMNNACLLYGRDTAGTQQWLITMWGDNVIYVGDGSHDLHLRGYTTYVDNSNEFRCPNAIHAVGGNSMLQFDDRTDGFVWGWYATGSAARLWDNLEGDRVTIDRGGSITAVGNVRANGSIGTNGIWFGNSGGWWWTGSPIHTDSTVQCGDLVFGGNRLYNNSGYAYFDQTVHAAGVYSRGDIWNAGNINSGNQLNCPNACTAGYLHSTGDVKADGWVYCGQVQAPLVRGGAGNAGQLGMFNDGNFINFRWDGTCVFYRISEAVEERICWSRGFTGLQMTQDGGSPSGWSLQMSDNAGTCHVDGFSDARLKTNIRDTEIDALSAICRVPVRAFEWNELGRRVMPGIEDSPIGLVAQELREAMPHAVGVTVNREGLPPDILTIIHEHMTAYFFRAFQQLVERIEQLEERT